MDQGFKDTLKELKNASEMFLPKKIDINHEIAAPTGKYGDTNSSNQANKPTEKPEPTQSSAEIVKPEKILLEFDTVDRLTSEITRYSLRKIAFFAIFIAIVFLILQDWWMILVVGAIYFVVYVYFSAPAHKMHHIITSHGINFNGEQLYKWDEFTSFYIDRKEHHDIAVVNAKVAIPGRLYLILPKEISTSHTSEILNSFLSITKKPNDTFIDKIMNFVGQKIKV